MQGRLKIFIHVIFWIVILVITGLETIPQFGRQTYYIITADYIMYAASMVSFFYFFYFFIKEKHLDGGKIILLSTAGMLLIFFMTIPIVMLYFYLINPEAYNDGAMFFVNSAKATYIGFIETNFFFAVSGTLLKSAFLWYDSSMKQKETEKQNIAGELALIKSQINPRFLFNTLGFIKSSILINPEKAIKGIEELSEIMSYMLYETSGELVYMDDEIRNIRNYINLKNSGMPELKTDLTVTGDTSGKKIPPLIFIPFIEIVFKLGEESSKMHSVFIKISSVEKSIIFSAEIKFTESCIMPASFSEDEIASATRRLDLIYGNRYNFHFKSEDGISKLILNLDNTAAI